MFRAVKNLCQSLNHLWAEEEEMQSLGLLPRLLLLFSPRLFFFSPPLSSWHVSHFGLLLSRDKCQITWCSIFIRSTLTGGAYCIKAWRRSSHTHTHLHADTHSHIKTEMECKVPALISPFLLFLITLVTHIHANTHNAQMPWHVLAHTKKGIYPGNP